MSKHTVTLDVREDIRSGRDPFRRIMQTVALLPTDGKLRLYAPFEPRPLFQVLAGKGFCHQAKPLDGGDWEVLYERTSGPIPDSTPTPEAGPPTSHCHQAEVVEVDARGLEPPQPMMVILEAVAKLPAGGQLKARTDRRPMHLYAPLQERGLVAESEEQNDGSYLTIIHRV